MVILFYNLLNVDNKCVLILYVPVTQLIFLDMSFSFGKIPKENRHVRKGLRRIHCLLWTNLITVANWTNVNLEGMAVIVDGTKLVDPEVIQLTDNEKSRIIDYYQIVNGENSIVQYHVDDFHVCDNHNGKLYPAEKCLISCISF